MVVSVPVVGVSAGGQGKTFGLVVAAGPMPAGRLGRGGRPAGRVAGVVAVPLEAGVVGTRPAAARLYRRATVVVVVPAFRLAVFRSYDVRRR